MSGITSYDLGWKRIAGMHDQHWFRGSAHSKAAISHCGLMVRRSELLVPWGAGLCSYCQVVQDAKDKATAEERAAISPNKPLPEGVQSGKRSISNE